MSIAQEAVYNTDEMYMLTKISEQIVELKLEMAIVSERSETRYQTQLEMLKELKEIKDEMNNHREKIDSLITIRNFIYLHWWKLLIAGAFVFSSVELHKFIHLPN